MEQKTPGAKPPHYVEDEGLYVGVRPRINWTNQVAIENRFLKRKDKVRTSYTLWPPSIPQKFKDLDLSSSLVASLLGWGLVWWRWSPPSSTRSPLEGQHTTTHTAIWRHRADSLQTCKLLSHHQCIVSIHHSLNIVTISPGPSRSLQPETNQYR